MKTRNALAFVVLIAGLVITATAYARPKKSELAMPTCATLNQLWKTRYHSALHIMWPLRDIDCSRRGALSYERTFAEAAFILENTRFRLENVPTDMQAPPTDMLKFVTSKYRGLTILAGATNPSTDVARKILNFYPAVAKETGYQVIGNLIHEARHADGNPYLHRLCLDGPNMGKEMCDNGLGDSFNEGGPHRVASLYFAWAAARSNWPKAEKDKTRGVAEWVVRTRINALESERNAWVAKYLHDW